MSRDRLLLVLIILVSLLQLLLVWQLISPSLEIFASKWVWLTLHSVTAALFGCCAGYWMGANTQLKSKPVAFYMGIMALCMPGVGGAAALVSAWIGYRVWVNREADLNDFVVTENTSLPFTTPIGRKASVPDSRGFVEQLRYSDDSDNLYQKVLSSSYIRNSISVDVLREAVSHSDERIRLTAYQILDRKVNDLNAEIQRLETLASNNSSDSLGIMWLQIANNYWELLTLERGDAVARRQLLKKAVAAAKKSVGFDSENRNAQLVLGRVCIAHGDFDTAEIALEKALTLGMPTDKVVPYMAEVAFGKREFKKVQQLLASLDDAFKQYPPLKQVAEYWA